MDYTTLRDAAIAAFARMKPGQRLFDGLDYWDQADLLAEADARNCADAYTVARDGAIGVPGQDRPLYIVVGASDDGHSTALAVARHFGGLTQKQLAEKSGVAVQKISGIESGVYKIGNVSLRVALALADALNVHPRELMDD